MPGFRNAFISLYIAVFISSVGLGILSPILPAYVDRYSAGTLLLGLVFGAYSASRTLFMTPVGLLSDRFGRKRFIAAGLALFAVVSPMYALSSTAAELMLVRFIQGIAAAMMMPVAMSYIGELSPRGREGFVMGTFTSAFFAGLGFGPLIGGFLSDRYTVETAFYGMGILSVAAFVVIIVSLPPSAGARPAVDEPCNKVESVEHLRQGKRLTGLLLFRFTRAVGIGIVWVLMPLFAVNELGISSMGVGILLSLNTFITTLLQSPLGHMSDRFGHLRSIMVGSLAAAGATAWISKCGGFSDLAIVSAVLGISGAMIVPAGSALAVKIGRFGRMGRTMGLYNTALSTGTMTGPVLGGLIADLFGIKAVFPIGGSIGVFGCIALLVLHANALRGSSVHFGS